jgi:hypothetical protein
VGLRGIPGSRPDVAPPGAADNRGDMRPPPAPHHPRRPRRRGGKALLVLAVLGGCAAAMAALLALVSSTGSPVEGPALPLLALALVASPVVLAVIPIARILGGGAARDDDAYPP